MRLPPSVARLGLDSGRNTPNSPAIGDVQYRRHFSRFGGVDMLYWLHAVETTADRRHDGGGHTAAGHGPVTGVLAVGFTARLAGVHAQGGKHRDVASGAWAFATPSSNRLGAGERYHAARHRRRRHDERLQLVRADRPCAHRRAG